MHDQLDLREFTEDMLAISRTNLERDGDLLPMAFVLTQTGDIHVLGLADLSTDRNKRTSYMMVSKYAAKEHAQAVLLINDAHYVKMDGHTTSREQANQVRPSKHPDRREAIIALLVKPDGTVAQMSAYPYSRLTDGKISWDKREIIPVPEGGTEESEQRMLPPWGPKVAKRSEVLS